MQNQFCTIFLNNSTTLKKKMNHCLQKKKVLWKMMITILTKSKSWSDEHKWTKSREKLNDHQNSKKTIMKDQDYCFFVIITLQQNQKISGILFGQAHLSLWYCVFGEWKISSFGWSLCLVNDKAGPYFYEIDQNFF